MRPQLPVHGRREATFSLLWILANAVGGAVGGTFIDANWLVGIALFGLAGGALEWIVLRPYLRAPVWWIPATGVGGIFAWAALPVYGLVATILFLLMQAVFVALRAVHIPIDAVISYALLTAASAAVGGAIGGAIVGAMQTPFLRRRAGSQVSWIEASSRGAALAAAVTGADLFLRVTEGLFGKLNPPRLTVGNGPSGFIEFPNGAASGAAFGLIYGLVTCLVLVQVLRHEARAQER